MKKATLEIPVFAQRQLSQINSYAQMLAQVPRAWWATGTFLVLWLMIANAKAQDFTYTNINGAITITGPTAPGGYVGALSIPSTINGLPVAAIGDSAFSQNSGLTSVTIGNSVIDIGRYAFSACISLTSVTIPNSVTKIGFLAFVSCDRLTTITVDSANLNYSSIGGVLFDKDQAKLIQYPSAKAGASFTIPGSVRGIEDWAFTGCSNLTSVTIPNGVTSIADGAFQYCSRLTSVVIPNGITSLADFTFQYCSSLTSITLPNGVTNIGSSAFFGCSSLTGVTIPNSVSTIGDSAFYGCTSLIGVTISNGVTSIADYAFGSCTSLTNVTIPNSVTSIGKLAFRYCSRLTNIMVVPLNSTFSSVDGVLFNQSETTLVECPCGKRGGYVIPNTVTSIGDSAFEGCTSLTDVTIPNSVASIGDSAFYSCSSLVGVTIPNSVTSIRGGAFAHCTSLTSVIIPNGITSLGGYAFYYCISLSSVYFQGNAPSGDSSVFSGDDNATAFYLPGTAGWGATFGGIPTALWSLPSPLILNSSVGVRANEFGFTVSWATNVSVVVEASNDLNSPKWSPVKTNALSGGALDFSDSQWTNFASRFYRIRSP